MPRIAWPSLQRAISTEWDLIFGSDSVVPSGLRFEEREPETTLRPIRL